MPPALDIPVIQNWSCHSCGGCCRRHAVDISEEEHARIVAQGWTEADGVQQPFDQLHRGGLEKEYRLGHQPNGDCVFLNEQGLCRIHAKFGEPAKPLACRLYPYTFHPAGRKITVGIRFSCPSVIANNGRPMTDQKSDLLELEKLVVPPDVENFAVPPITSSQTVDWPDMLKIVSNLEELIADRSVPLPIRIMRALAFLRLLESSRFKKLSGERFEELLSLLSAEACRETSNNLLSVPPPSRIGRMLFRLLAAQYARQDTTAILRGGLGRRFQLLGAALRIACGRGKVPVVEDRPSQATFQQLDQSFGMWPLEVDEVLERYFRVKIHSLHFFGAAYYHVPLVEGFQSLVLVLPAILWGARWMAVTAGRTQITLDDLAVALRAADHNHGFSPIVGRWSFRGRVRILSALDDVRRLVAAYCR